MINDVKYDLQHKKKDRKMSKSPPITDFRCLASSIDRSLLKCSVQVWPGHSKTLTGWSQSHCFVFLGVFLGSLSCWKVNFCTQKSPEEQRALLSLNRFAASDERSV